MPTRRFVVSGKVQGVGFRAFVADLANDLGIGGEVWNRRDGCVELLAHQADLVILDRLEAKLRGGPGRVDGIDAYDAPDDQFEGFRVGASR